MVKHKEIKNGVIFPIGDKNDKLSEHFTGQSYLERLVEDPAIEVGVSNVTFEPGVINDWHIHHDGFQILLVTAGEGWYQEENNPPQFLQAGDTVIVHEGIKHWHGATKDSWFVHLSISSGRIEWLEAVSETEYSRL